MSLNIATIPQNKKQGWTIQVNGEEVNNIRHIKLSNPDVGTWEYGLHPGGFDAWRFRENGGGGSFTLPYAKTEEGELLVGLIEEDRDNMGGLSWCITGGFVDQGESHKQAGDREAMEESGLSAITAKPSKSIPGCTNRFFNVANVHEDEGNHKQFLSMPMETLEQTEEHGGCWKIKPGFQKAVPKGEKGTVRFFHWKQAVTICGDTIGRSGIAQLLAEEL